MVERAAFASFCIEETSWQTELQRSRLTVVWGSRLWFSIGSLFFRAFSVQLKRQRHVSEEKQKDSFLNSDAAVKLDKTPR